MTKRTILMSKSAIPGGVIAIALSYAINHSIMWCILHAILGWMYVLYWLFSYTNFSDYINQFVVR
jgi:hypothetical protein